MLHKLAVPAIAAIAFALPVSSAQGQQLLASFGDTDFTDTNSTTIGQIETYVIDCFQDIGTCFDNDSREWGVTEPPTDVQIQICDPRITDLIGENCVHEVQVNIETTEPFVDTFVTFVRAGAESNALNFNNNNLGRAFASGEGGTLGEEGVSQNVSYSLGLITPNKTHTLFITAPEFCDPSFPIGCNGKNFITGIFIDGMSLRDN